MHRSCDTMFVFCLGWFLLIFIRGVPIMPRQEISRFLDSCFWDLVRYDLADHIKNFLDFTNNSCSLVVAFVVSLLRFLSMRSSSSWRRSRCGGVWRSAPLAKFTIRLCCSSEVQIECSKKTCCRVPTHVAVLIDSWEEPGHRHTKMTRCLCFGKAIDSINAPATCSRKIHGF